MGIISCRIAAQKFFAVPNLSLRSEQLIMCAHAGGRGAGGHESEGLGDVH